MKVYHLFSPLSLSLSLARALSLCLPSTNITFSLSPYLLSLSSLKDEIFGPVLSIYVCKDRDEAIAIENGCEYGNAACIYTSIGQNADWFTSRFTGMCFLSSPCSPQTNVHNYYFYYCCCCCCCYYFYYYYHTTANMLGVNVGVPVPREPFSFGGMGTSKFGETDITGDGAIEFFSRRQKITTKWVPPSAANKSWMN